MKEICIFDLDGTLVNSMEHLAKGWLSVLDDHHIPYTVDFLRTLLPLGFEKSARLFVEMGVKDSPEHVTEIITERLVEAYTHKVKLKEGVAALLTKLQSEGKRLFVLTASPHATCDPCLKENLVWDFFEQVWSVDDFSLTKGEVLLFETVCEKIGCRPEEVTFFDDSVTAIETCKKAGMEAYGIAEHQPPEELERIRAACDLFVERFSELL